MGFPLPMGQFAEPIGKAAPPPPLPPPPPVPPPPPEVESVEEPEVVPLVDTGYDSDMLPEDRSGRKVVDISRGGDDASDRGSGEAGRRKKKKERKTADEEDRDRDRDREKKKEGKKR